MSSLRMVCSCTNVNEPVQHSQWCELWSDYSFKHGTAIWSREFFRLVNFLEWASVISKEHKDLSIDAFSDMWPATDRLRSTEHIVDEVSREEADAADRAERLVQLMDEIEIEAQMNDPGEEILDEEPVYDCPHCGYVGMSCVDCGFCSEDCECGELTTVYCPQCSHLFELVVADAEDQIEEVPTLVLVEEPELELTEGDDEEEDDDEEPLIPPMCYCDPPKKYYCIEDGVGRSKPEDEWSYISKYDPMCTCKPKKSVFCYTCGVQKKNDRWQFDPSYWEIKNDQLVRKNFVGGTGGMYSSFGGGYVQKCRHKEAVVTFPDGTKVWASSCHERKPEEPAPDFGLYLANSWKPACLAYAVAWPDMNLPAYPEVAADAILDVFTKAKDGQIVEVGCIGGHGRTGTALGCMAVLGGVKPKEAVKWVRDNYCEEAVESDRQAWWVEWFADFVNGTNDAGAEPPKPVYKSSYNTTHSQEDHYKMYKDNKECKKDWDAKEKKSVPCSFWAKDVDSFEKGVYPKGGGSGKVPATNSVTATSAPATSSQHATAGKAGGDDSRFRTPATCLRPDCGASMPFNSAECPTCNLAYAPGFWTWHVKKQQYTEEIKQEIADLAGVVPAPKVVPVTEEERTIYEVGTIKGDFVWTGALDGWQPLSLASQFLPDFQWEGVKVVNRHETRKERKRRLRRERNKKNRRR